MNYVELLLRQKDFTFKKELVECALIGKPFKKRYTVCNSDGRKLSTTREYQKIQYKNPTTNCREEGIIPAYIIY